jgi:hypothetical protein
MGGLNGYPFAGLTGMNAFTNHVPENGAIIGIYQRGNDRGDQ